MKGFSDQIAGFKAKSLAHLDRVRRASILELFSLVLDETPVDTGRLRGNWQVTLNTAAGGIVDRLDPGGNLTKSELLSNLGSLADVVFMTNNLPYVARIEFDAWSPQRPEGMIRKNAMRWREIVAAKAKGYTQ